MSDFFNAGWSIYIAAVVILGLLGCLALLIIASRSQNASVDNTTGHVWDEDLRELNNPLPRWWMWLFVITIVFAGIYLWLYPGLGSSKGSLGWTSAGQLKQEQAQVQAQIQPLYAAFAHKPVPELARDPQVMAVGERLFANNCAACHGADARGSKGFPDLTDHDWLWGGSPERIEETITKGRRNEMPSLAAAVGTQDDVQNLAAYVMTLSGTPDSTRAQLGRSKFMICAACHGPEGKGNPAIGVPNLTDNIWLHGRGEKAVVAMVTHGKVNVMPAQEGRLAPEQIHVLAAYVWGLSNRPGDAAGR